MQNHGLDGLQISWPAIYDPVGVAALRFRNIFGWHDSFRMDIGEIHRLMEPGENYRRARGALVTFKEQEVTEKRISYTALLRRGNAQRVMI